jgi:glycerol-3-phosphate dehydrogenase
MTTLFQPHLSAINRTALVEQLTDAATAPHFDLLVIGGGITGAGIALDAASRGLKVLLLEMQDFSAGTSSRSTKLIHGGLRYLKQGDVKLVQEVGQERALLHRNAPHIVKPKKMLLPIIQQGALGKYSTSFALFVYDLIAGVAYKEWRTMHDKDETAQLEPLLRTDILIGGGMYFEYQTDDARLTIEVLKSAVKFGAVCLNYTQVKGLEYDEKGKAIGLRVIDKIASKPFYVYADHIVNAAGPWVDEVRRFDQAVSGKHLRLTKGVHIVVPYSRLPLQQAAYFDVKDGRMIFAIPRGENLYIGTTDTDYKQRHERPQTTAADVRYLLDATNAMYPNAQLNADDVLSSWAGVRPLIQEEGKSPSEVSRRDEIFYSKSGLITIAGGKLTGFRKMAERTVDEVMKQRAKAKKSKLSPCITDKIKLSGGNFGTPETFDIYLNDLVISVAERGISPEQISDIANKYGKNTEIILHIFDEQSAQNPRWRKKTVTTAQRLLLAELHYGVHYEMVCSLSDFLVRRSGRLYFDRPNIAQYRQLISDELATLLGWTRAQTKQYDAEFETEYQAVVAFKQEKMLDEDIINRQENEESPRLDNLLAGINPDLLKNVADTQADKANKGQLNEKNKEKSSLYGYMGDILGKFKRYFK